MNVIFLGPVGSGKSTQAELVSKSLGLSLFNVGDFLHFKSLEKTAEGEKIREGMEAGELVDDKLVLFLVEGHLKEKEHSYGVVVDGFPRNLWQAENFSLPTNAVVYLEVADSVNKERLLKRGRADDTAEMIDKRLAIYHQETEPIINYYQTLGKLIRVNGEGKVGDITEDILGRLKERS